MLKIPLFTLPSLEVPVFYKTFGLYVEWRLKYPSVFASIRSNNSGGHYTFSNLFSEPVHDSILSFNSTFVFIFKADEMKSRKTSLRQQLPR